MAIYPSNQASNLVFQAEEIDCSNTLHTENEISILGVKSSFESIASNGGSSALNQIDSAVCDNRSPANSQTRLISTTESAAYLSLPTSYSSISDETSENSSNLLSQIRNGLACQLDGEMEVKLGSWINVGNIIAHIAPTTSSPVPSQPQDTLSVSPSAPSLQSDPTLSPSVSSSYSVSPSQPMSSATDDISLENHRQNLFMQAGAWGATGLHASHRKCTGNDRHKFGLQSEVGVGNRSASSGVSFISRSGFERNRRTNDTFFVSEQQIGGSIGVNLLAGVIDTSSSLSHSLINPSLGARLTLTHEWTDRNTSVSRLKKHAATAIIGSSHLVGTAFGAIGGPLAAGALGALTSAAATGALTKFGGPLQPNRRKLTLDLPNVSTDLSLRKECGIGTFDLTLRPSAKLQFMHTTELEVGELDLEAGLPAQNHQEETTLERHDLDVMPNEQRPNLLCFENQAYEEENEL